MPSINVQGMTCNHCKASVTEAVSKVPGVASVNVDLLKGEASWTENAPVDKAKVREAIINIGFEVPD
ncbi:heavy-metal-associated domain-containing protein [Desulfovibrio psychrotolerans]|uniref:Mercury transporter n=1 Tax=Desulfovibrio psychrotolerans TaxID=415242 RepID=A0A7J0BSE6_9BACT|nr:cation transporter [Desulfovibrio psychrotolerans]GFM36131.1 mercury transporter [Desulfovibrio psychrotolerans]